MLRRVALLLAVAVAVVCARANASVPTTNPIGEAINPDDDCAITWDADRVTIITPDSPHDFAAELKQWNAPRVLSDVQGDFVVEVNVSGTFAPEAVSLISGRTAYNGAGILVVGDEQNHLSLQRAALFSNGHFRHYLNFELRRDGKMSTARWQMDVKDADARLRLERVGDRFTASFSQDGKTWKSYEPIKADLPQQVKVGVEAVNSTDREFRCAFDQFALFLRAQPKVEAGETKRQP